MSRGRTRPALVDAVFGLPRPERRGRLAVALLAAGVGHGGLWLLAALSEPTLESWSAAVAAQVHAELSKVEAVELPRPPVPTPTPPPPAPAPVPTAPRQATVARPPPPAQAGNIVAQAVEPSGPVDLTQDTFVTGTAEAYAGGVTTSTGTSTTAVTAQEVAPGPQPTGPQDRSSVVGLDDDSWSCPWPKDAEEQDIDEQLVVLRVTVRADGTAESASLASDPGHGFGQAALACALATRFSPARDASGQAITARSPPIRVRFTR